MPQFLIPVITALGVTGTIAGTEITVASVIANLVFYAGIAGADYVLSQKKTPSTPLKNTIKQSDSPRYMGFGRNESSGVAFFYEVTGSILGIGIVVSAGEIDAIETWIVDDEVVTIDGGGLITSGQKHGYGVLQFYNGTSSGGYSSLLSTYFGSIWDPTHICQDLSCIYGKFTQAKAKDRQAVYPNGFPQIKVVWRGAKCFDPRTGTTVWTQNPILVAAWYMTHPEGGKKGPLLIDWLSVIAGADLCDRSVAKYGGGTEPFATCSGIIMYDEEVRTVLGRIMAACDGTYYETSEGLIGFRVMEWQEPNVILTDNDIVSIKVQWSRGALAEFNYVFAKYNEPSRNYQNVDAPPIFDEESIAVAGQKSTNVNYDYVNSVGQAFRLGTRHLRRNVGQRIVTITGGPRLMLLIGEIVCGLSLEFAGVSGVFDVMQLQPNGGSHQWTLSLRETTRDVYEDVIPPRNPLATIPLLTVAPLETPSGVVVTVITSGTKNLQCSCSAPSDPTLTLTAQVRVADIGGGIPGNWVDYPTQIAENIVLSTALSPNTYQTWCWFEDSIGRSGPVYGPFPTTIT